MDPRRSGICGLGAGFRYSVLLDATRRPLARRNGEDGNGPNRGRHRPRWHPRDYDHNPRCARPGRREGIGRKPMGHVHGCRHDPDRHAHGCLHAEHPARQSGRGLCIRRDRSLVRHLVWPVRGRGHNARASFHLQRACPGLGNHRLWRHRLYAASVAPPRSSRLPQHVPQDRRHCRARDRHLSGPARSEDGGRDPFHRR